MLPYIQRPSGEIDPKSILISRRLLASSSPEPYSAEKVNDVPRNRFKTFEGRAMSV